MKRRRPVEQFSLSWNNFPMSLAFRRNWYYNNSILVVSWAHHKFWSEGWVTTSARFAGW
jgi:hypothetical protein